MNSKNCKEKIEKMEKDIHWLRKSNAVRDIYDQLLAEDILEFKSEVKKNLQNLEKELFDCKEKIDDNSNNINEHQRNEQIIFQKMAQLSKELRKMKKEMDKYA
jgi:chromosome segregation ATPase